MREEASKHEYQDLLDGIREQERVEKWGMLLIAGIGIGGCWLAGLPDNFLVLGAIVSVIGGWLYSRIAHVTVLLYKAELRELLHHGVPPDNDAYHLASTGRKKPRER